MRGLGFAAVAVAALLAASPTAFAQQDQGSGLGGALDQLNRTFNSDRQSNERDRRYEGTSGSSRERGDSSYQRYSDRELQGQYNRVVDEQRRLDRERRDLEDELSRRGMDR